MFATFITVALFAATSVAGYTLDTPQLTQCQDANLTWSNAKGIVNIIAVPAADTCNGKILADIGDHDGNSFTWKVALPAGAKVVLTTIDTAEEEAWTNEITVGESDDTSCIPDELKKDLASLVPSSTSASAASTSSAAGTLVVSPTIASSASSAYTSPSSTPGVVGGVASDPLSAKSNGAARQATTPMLVLGALSAILVACL